MKIETFFEKFDQLADAPNAVAKMRELLLQLAVQGKLVPQDEQDTPASTLLEIARADRAQLVVDRKIKERRSIPVGMDERPFELPPSWEWTRLSEVGCEIGQKVPDKRFTYIDVSSIAPDRGCISKRVQELEPNEAPSRARKLVERGTVIYSTVRPYLLNIAIIDRDFDHEPIASTAFAILHPFAGISSGYLFYWLRSAPFTAYVQDGMKGMAYPAINDEKFYSGFIPLPPFAEQERIVAKVNELLGLCDRLEAQQQERDERHAALARGSLARFAEAPTPANLTFLFHDSYTIEPADLRKTILTLAVQGSLGSTNEAKHVLLGDVIELISGQHLLGDEQNEEGKGIPYLTGPSDFGPKHPIPSRWTETPKVVAKPGDILITVKGSGVGKTNKLVAGLTAISRQLMAVRATGADPDYVHLVLMSVADHFQALKIGIAIPGIGRKDVLGIRVELPSLAEQRRIVAKVDKLMALIDQLEAQVAASKATATSLMNALVAELTAEV